MERGKQYFGGAYEIPYFSTNFHDAIMQVLSALRVVGRFRGGPQRGMQASGAP